MTLGLPSHLARDSMSRALAHAGHCAAWVCLAVGALAGVTDAVTTSGPAGWIWAALCAGMALLLALVARFDSVTLTVVYLVAGTGAVFAGTMLVMDSAYGFQSTDNILLALPRIALLLVGGAGAGSAIAITWATLGFSLGGAVTFVGAMLTGAAWAPNTAAATAFGILVVVRIYDGVTRASDQRRETGLHRASQQTRELAIRHDYELRATARLHDTALSHLVGIATVGSGPVDERLRDGIRRDLSLIVGRDWVTEHAHSADERRLGVETRSPGSRSADAAAGPVPTLEQASTTAQHAGLDLRVNGDLAVLSLLGPGRATALDQAVAQCIVNVARHAGVTEVELAIGFAGGEVTVAVIDGGFGFDESEVPEDRIGLRTSVRARIEQEGGSVRIWSTKGIGTTVVLTVPVGGR